MEFHPPDTNIHGKILQSMTILDGLVYRKPPVFLKNLRFRFTQNTPVSMLKHEMFFFVGECCG